MKKANLFFSMLAVAVAMTSCGGGEHKETAEHTDEAMHENRGGEVIDWVIDTEKSTVRWEGGTTGAQVYSHFGEIDIKEGLITTEGDQVKNGVIQIDMTTIDPMDEGYSAEHPESDLVGHLSSPDFFDVANHPTAKFEVKSIEGNQVKGNLTVRGITHEETIIVDALEINPDGIMHAIGNLDFDRQKYDVKWAHFMQDVVLSDQLHLQFDITAKKA